MIFYLGIDNEIKKLIIILYYFYLGIKYNVYSELFKKRKKLRIFLLIK